MPIFGSTHSMVSTLPVTTAIFGMLSFGCCSACLRGRRVCSWVSAVFWQHAGAGTVICRRHLPSWITTGTCTPGPHGTLVRRKVPLVAE